MADAASPSSTPASDDASDIAAACQGDSAAYARVIRRYQPQLARRMTRFARQRADLEELVQDVFVEAYYALPTYRADAPLEHWLQRIATRVGYRYWKKQKMQRRLPTSPIEAADAIAGEIDPDKNESAEKLKRVLDELPPRDRLVVTLLYVEGQSTEEAARQIGWSRTMVKVQAFRARGKLKKLLERAEGMS